MPNTTLKSQKLVNIFINEIENQGVSDTQMYSKVARLGDGSLSDNTGILSLLARGIKHIICFCNTETLISDYITKCDNTILSLFGLGLETCILSNLALNTIQVFNTTDYNNHILPQFQDSYNLGGPTFARQSLLVLPNKINGILGGYTVDILFILLQPSTNFIKQLPKDVQDNIYEESIKTILNNLFILIIII